MNASNYQTLLENLYEGIYYVDLERRIKYWSKGAEIITGYKSSDVIGKQCSDKFLAHTSLTGKNLCKSACLMRNTLATGSYNKTEVYLRHKDGHNVHISLRISPMYDAQKNIVGATHIFTNNEAYLSLRPDEIKKNYELYYDNITGLPSCYNSKLILKTKIEEFRRYHWPFATFIMHIDNFEHLKKIYELNLLDGIIKHFSSLIKQDIRPFDILGRWSENQFMVILINVKKKAMLMLGERMRTLIENSVFTAGKNSINLTFSQSGALIGKDIQSEDLIEKLEELLKQSIAAGGNRSSYHVF
ncbi:MAG: sensor domain-containing diguanylate cyclase [Candidatus Cloacimonadales bacterium]|nr:sensor domain-containing diguanylate cyclase [Candidatus Cloacimonadales bacterium]